MPLLIWATLRIPLLLVFVYVFRYELVALVESWVGLARPTALAISLLSTLPERGLFLLLCSGALTVSFVLALATRSVAMRYLLPAGVSFLLFVVAFRIAGSINPYFGSLALTSVLLVNSVSQAWFVTFISRGPGRHASNLIFALAVGLSETLLLRPLLLWLLVRTRGHQSRLVAARSPLLDWIPCGVLVPALGAVLLSGNALADLSRTLRADQAVQIFATGDFNGLAFDAERNLLYASGHGVSHLRAYDVRDLHKPPRRAATWTANAQALAYNPSRGEIYVFNAWTRHLLVLNAGTLALKRSIDMPPVAPGDVWVVWDEETDRIILASEADIEKGPAIVVVDRITGRVVDTLDISPSNVLLHPHKPLLYGSFFRRENELIMYNILLNRIELRVPTEPRLNRMVFHDGEVLVAAPLESAVIRFDADTLERKGTIKTLLGVRTLAVDPLRNLLLCGSLVTSMLEVVDLPTHERIAAYHVGPWLRTISLDVSRGVAYVSSIRGLYEVQYTARSLR